MAWELPAISGSASRTRAEAEGYRIDSRDTGLCLLSPTTHRPPCQDVSSTRCARPPAPAAAALTAAQSALITGAGSYALRRMYSNGVLTRGAAAGASGSSPRCCSRRRARTCCSST